MSFRMLSCVVVFRKMKLNYVWVKKIILCCLHHPSLCWWLHLSLYGHYFCLLSFCCVGLKKKSLHFLHLSLFFCYNFLTCNCSFSCISYTCHHSFIVIGSKRRINILFFILLHCWCLPLFFCSYTLNPSLLLALLSLFYRTSIGMLQVLWKWKKNLKAFFNQLLILIMQMLLKGWLGMVMVELNLNQLMS